MPPRLTTTSTSTSGFVTMHTVNGVEYNYVYDSVGNIMAVYKDFVRVASYSYDKLGQLTLAFLTADDGTQDVYEYYYDKSGNITNALRHRGDTTQESQYTYGNATWGDLLTKYNGVNISYDAIGNPINWRNSGSLMWQGRRLALFSHINGEQYMYTYNSDGIRTSKQIRNADNALITGVEYIYDGSKLVAEIRDGVWMYYVYDETGSIAGLSYNNTLYFFRKNLQGDVTGIYNANGALIAEYSYTPYGEILAITDTNGNDVSGNSTHIANINPIRYRGYYYDTETGFYYIQTRYYDPVVGRFINADGIIGANGDIIGYNMFAYCGNSPINCVDIKGYWSLKGAWNSFKKGVKKAGEVVVEIAETVYEVVVEPVVEVIEEAAEVTTNVMEDISNFDPLNTNEQKVLDSHYFSIYKGRLTIRTNMERSGSFSVLFINQKANADTVRHEYGHTIQLALLGPFKYLACIGLPSWQKWGSDSYYDKPWEVTADVFGGVESRNHSDEKVYAGFEYLFYSKYYGPRVWNTID